MFKKVYVEITNSCNFNCSFCFHGKRQKKFLSLEEFSVIAQKVGSFTQHIYLHVTGEPLTHPHLWGILDIAHNNGLLVNITTNGSLLTRHLQTMQHPAVRQINISLHDWEENTNTSTCFQRMTEMIETARQLATTKYICFRLWNITDSDSIFSRKCLQTLSQTLEIQDISAKASTGNGFTLLPNIFMQNEKRFTWPSPQGIPNETPIHCFALRDHIAILSDGTVVPCCLDADGNMPLGNIFTQEIDDILRQPLAISMRESFKKHQASHPFCKTCGFHRR